MWSVTEKKYKKQTMLRAISGFGKKAQVQQEASAPKFTSSSGCAPVWKCFHKKSPSS